ncbi:MAG TPA: GAF domain-containing protein [Anaerolineales bacterium]
MQSLFRQPGASEEEKLETQRILQAFLIILIVLLAVLLIVDGIFAQRTRTLYALIPVEIIYLASLWYLRKGNFYLAQVAIPAGALFARVFLAFNDVGLHDVTVSAFIAIVILAYLTLSQRGAFWFTWLIVLSTTLIGIREIYYPISGYSLNTTYEDIFLVDVFILATSGIMAVTIRQFNNSLFRSRKNEQAQIAVNTELIALQEKVRERTEELESANKVNTRRAEEFEALMLVANAINSIRKMDELLPQITSVISKRFGYYHVGIFLNDENSQQAILSAANSEGGQQMLKRGHRLKIGEQGIVGNVAATGSIRIARNVGEDAAYFNNPDLPETLAEMAMPLRSGSKIIGVLDVQSKQADAFPQEVISILSLLADQVSLVIENTRLLETTSKSLAEAEALYRQYLRQAWNRLPREERLLGYRYTVSGSSPLENPIDLGANAKDGSKNQDEASRLIVPIKLRGELIGNLVVQAPQGTQWNPDQLDLVQAVADRVALSAENARLFDETSRRAERERMVTEITSKIRSTNNPEEMVGIALNELRNALGATKVQLIPQAVTAPKDDSTLRTSAVSPVMEEAHKGNGAKQ